ncbi:hypothetical protein BDY17DRAFT_250966 [Neohortaea acidophila]|uniref:SUN domain-containing protein n=1 Tax=Neohortaea acidophila TaxID=245834 RepID=A0A6A6PS60_9PEZI|nr:uncharacterized protein BDY17DRAFT_250966 [Neohortaea acidophila]KAF2482939.1 hypothetical protein BDY17DRAFT_250966 [Neohortaea acidophila]
MEGPQGRRRRLPTATPRAGRRDDASSVIGDATFADRTATALDAGAHYGPFDHDDILEEEEEEEPVRHEPVRRSQPSSLRVFARALPRYVPRLLRSANPALKDLLLLISGFITLTLLVALTPLPSSISPYRDYIFSGVKTSLGIEPSAKLQSAWYQLKHDKLFSDLLPDHNIPEQQFAININYLQRIEELEANMRALEGDMRLTLNSWRVLEQALPSKVVVHVIDGRYEIPEVFWNALQEKLAGETDMTPLWQSYIQGNEREIEHLNQQLISLQLDRAIQSREVVSRDAFIEAIEENNAYMSSNFRDEFRAMQQTHLAEVKALAIRSTQDELQTNPLSFHVSEQLQMLIKANQVRNTYQALRSVNWFSLGNQARINPAHTSTTFYPPRNWLHHVYHQFSPFTTKPHPPTAALSHWNEAGDCWCAKPKSKTDPSISIGIYTNEKIFPEKLILDHVPMEGTLSIKTAPKDIELWASAGSKKTAAKLAKLVREHRRYPDAECDPANRPDARYVCVARGKYDVHEGNHVQVIPVFADMQALGFGVEDFVVRASTNWGGRFTCLYRVRMIGEKAIPDSGV